MKCLAAALFLGVIVLGLYFTFHKPHKPKIIKYPAIEFEQFRALYATAPELWDWTLYPPGTKPTRSISHYNTDYLMVQYTIRQKIGSSYFSNEYKYFAIYADEAKKFVKFFVNEANKAQEKVNNEQLIKCLSYWREDAARAEERAKRELEQAKENYLKISSNLKYENYYTHE